jgi:hypothetical protein
MPADKKKYTQCEGEQNVQNNFPTNTIRRIASYLFFLRKLLDFSWHEAGPLLGNGFANRELQE